MKTTPPFQSPRTYANSAWKGILFSLIRDHSSWIHLTKGGLLFILSLPWLLDELSEIW